MLRGEFAGLLVFAAFSFGQQPPASATWTMEPQAREAGYRIEMLRDGITPCAVILPPSKPVAGRMLGSMEQVMSAAPYRGKTIRLSAWIRVQSAGLQDSAQLWMRINRP